MRCTVQLKEQVKIIPGLGFYKPILQVKAGIDDHRIITVL